MKFYIAAFCASFGVGILAVGLLIPLLGDQKFSIESLLGFSLISEKIEAGPAVVVTVSSAKSLIGDANYFSQSFGVDPTMIKMVKSGLDRALVGVDQDRPFGAAVYFKSGKTDPCLLYAVPVTNFERFFASLEAFGPVSKSKMTFQPPGQQQLMIREKNGYALLSADVSAFQLVPENPFELFRDAADTHRIACHIYGARIPKASKDEFFEGFQEGIKTGSRKATVFAESDIQEMFSQFGDVIYNTDTIFFGFDFDRRRQNLVIDFEIEGNSQSRYAKTAKLNQNLPPTKFAGFIGNASALNAVVHTNVPKEEAESFRKSLQVPLEQFKSTLADNLPADECEKCVALAEKMLAALQDTIASGYVDFGATMDVGDNHLMLAIGAAVPDPAEFEIAGKELFQLIQSADKTVQIRDSADSYQGVVFHELVAEPSAISHSRLPFDSEIRLVLGIAEKEVYLALGSNPIVELKQLIDDSRTVSGDIPMMVSNISMSQWSHLLEGDNSQAGMFKKIVADLGGKDKLALRIDTTDRGQRMHFQMDTAVFSSARKMVNLERPTSVGSRRSTRTRSSQTGSTPFERLQRATDSSSGRSTGVGDAEAEFLRRVYSH